VLLVAAVALCYWNSLGAPFLFDDIDAVVNNPTIRHLASQAALNPPADGNTAMGRPVINFSFAINHAISGERVWSYHALNVAIHTLAALTLMSIVRRTLSGPVLREHFGAAARPLGFLIALLWALHPLQTESVVCIAQRAESLCGLCYLLTLYGFIRGAEPGARSGRWFAFSAAVCLVGMGAKEVMGTAPLVVLLYDRTFVAGAFSTAWRQRRVYYSALACTWLLLAWLVLRGGGTRGVSAGFGLGVSWWTYLLTQGEAILLYLKLSIWPHPLVLDYGMAVVRSVADVWAQAIVVLALLGLTIWALIRKPVAGFLGAWFFIILAPSSSVVPIVTQTMAEHRMYLPLAGVVALGVCGVYTVVGRRSTAVFLVLAAVFGVLTTQRNADYRSELSIWSKTVAQCPDNYRARNTLADVLVRLGRDREAIGHCAAALRLNPRYAVAHNTLGNALANTGHPAEAIVQYEEALQLEPGFVEAHSNLGNMLLTIPGRLPEAVRHFEMALRIRPDFAALHFNLGNALLGFPERRQEAMAHFQTALRLEPGLRPARQMLEKLSAARHD
jgi:tetratricopeptide (TPR) repeat protein